jgi:hypothetical protein
MSVNFNPLRERMSKEIDQCIAIRNMDTLLSFCNSCISSRLPKRFAYECQNCKVQRAIAELSSKKRIHEHEDEEFFSVS